MDDSLTYLEASAETTWWSIGTMIEIDNWWFGGNVLGPNKVAHNRGAILIVTEYYEEGGIAGDEYEGWIEGDLMMKLYEPKEMLYHEFDPRTLRRMIIENEARVLHIPEKSNE